jgi:hypothetical protein
MNMMVSTAAIATATPARAAKGRRRGSIVSLCEQVQALLAESNAISAALSAAHKRAEVEISPPPELAFDALIDTPDFAGIRYRFKTDSPEFWEGQMPIWAIESLVKDAEGGKTAEWLDETDDWETMRIYKKPLPPKPEALERAARLRKLLDIANDYHARLAEARLRHGYHDWDEDPRAMQITNRADDLVRRIAAKKSETPEDLLAKVALYQTDTDWFSDSPKDGCSLLESIARDLPALLDAPDGSAIAA